MAFAKSTQARHPHYPHTRRGALTTLQTSLHAADRSVAPPRFDPGLSTGPGGFTTGDLGVSPDRTFTGWLTRACARLRHDHSFAVVTSELLDARGSRLRGGAGIIAHILGDRSSYQVSVKWNPPPY